jgi:hypothetical protein
VPFLGSALTIEKVPYRDEAARHLQHQQRMAPCQQRKGISKPARSKASRIVSSTNLDDLACLRGLDLEWLVLRLRACAEALRVETTRRPTIYEMTDELQTRGFVPERTSFSSATCC